MFQDWPAFRLILAAVFFCGLAHIALLPPFEGFDETAHWSSITQIGYEGSLPVYGEARIDGGIDAYPGPITYAAPSSINYNDFQAIEGQGPHYTKPPKEYVGEGSLNWQAQHPPLYYLILQPVFKLFSDASWSVQFFALRTISWIFAFSGLVIGVEASRQLFKDNVEKAMVIMAAWPFLIPQFFPEMARIGNDSLCLLFFALCWLALVRLERREHDRGWSTLLGLALGVGLWTKAFFVPISAGLFLYFVWRFWGSRDAYWLRCGGRAIGLSALIGIGWYIYKLIAYGNAIGGDEMLQFSKEGGVLANFLQNFDIIEILRGYATMVGTFIYVGSWSLIRTSPILLLGPIILLGWCIFNWTKRLGAGEQFRLLPLFVLVPMLAGLTYHQMLRIAIDGVGSGTPGWYLHILAPALSAVVVWGWPKHWSVYLLVAYGIVFAAYSWVLQLSIYSGCSIEVGETGRLGFDPNKACLIDVSNLAAITFPLMAVFLLILAFSTAVFLSLKIKSK